MTTHPRAGASRSESIPLHERLADVAFDLMHRRDKPRVYMLAFLDLLTLLAPPDREPPVVRFTATPADPPMPSPSDLGEIERRVVKMVRDSAYVAPELREQWLAGVVLSIARQIPSPIQPERERGAVPSYTAPATVSDYPLPDDFVRPIIGEHVFCVVPGYAGCHPVAVIGVDASGACIIVKRADGEQVPLVWAPHTHQSDNTWHRHHTRRGTHDARQ